MDRTFREKKEQDNINKLGLYLLNCCERVGMSKHDPQFILLF